MLIRADIMAWRLGGLMGGCDGKGVTTRGPAARLVNGPAPAETGRRGKQGAVLVQRALPSPADGGISDPYPVAAHALRAAGSSK